MTEPLIRTGLYVPGDRPDRFGKAVASGADLVVLDLEDAVAPAAKAEARSTVTRWLAEHAADTGVVLQVRVNAGDEDDLRAVAGLDPRIGVRLPKVEGPRSLDRVAALAPDRPVTALLESPLAVLHAAEIAAHPTTSAIAIGESDLRSAIGGGRPVIDHARLVAVYAAGAAGLPAPMLAVHPALTDTAGLVEDTERGRDLGLFGRMAAHPAQLATIAALFRPSAADVAWAEEVLSAEPGGVRRTADGGMVDPAMAGRARRILLEQH